MFLRVCLAACLIACWARKWFDGENKSTLFVENMVINLGKICQNSEFPPNYKTILETTDTMTMMASKLFAFVDLGRSELGILNEIRYFVISERPAVLSGSKIPNTISVPMPILNG